MTRKTEVCRSPITPWFYGEKWAFNQDRGDQFIGKTWQLIPDDVDVLVTHGPPHGVLDMTVCICILAHVHAFANMLAHVCVHLLTCLPQVKNEAVGCEVLAQVVNRLNVPLHLFGHIHEAHGAIKIGSTTFSNASIVDVFHRPAHKPNVFDFELNTRTVHIVQDAQAQN